jgi:hypothetical protein
MALTLAESAKLSLDLLNRGVIETIIEDSPLFDYLPFINVEGNSFKYNQENALGAVGFFAVNGTWTEASSTYTQKTSNLTILGGDVDVDNFIQRSRSQIQDQRAIQVQLKAKNVGRSYESGFIIGDTGTDPNSFDGIRNLVAAGQTVTAGAGGGALTLSLLDQMLDLVKGSKPDMLLMSRRTRRKLKSLLQASTHYVENGTTSFGRQVLHYDGIPVFASDWQPDTEADGASGNVLSSIYAIYFSEGDGVCGLQNGSIETVDIGQLETKDAFRTRIRWYCSLAILRDSAIARLKAINAS